MMSVYCRPPNIQLLCIMLYETSSRHPVVVSVTYVALRSFRLINVQNQSHVVCFFNLLKNMKRIVRTRYSTVKIMNSIGIQYKLCLRIDVQDSVLDWNESAQYEKKLFFSKSNHSS
jgi:hypothetical protein